MNRAILMEFVTSFFQVGKMRIEAYPRTKDVPINLDYPECPYVWIASIFRRSDGHYLTLWFFTEETRLTAPAEEEVLAHFARTAYECMHYTNEQLIAMNTLAAIPWIWEKLEDARACVERFEWLFGSEWSARLWTLGALL